MIKLIENLGDKLLCAGLLAVALYHLFCAAVYAATGEQSHAKARVVLAAIFGGAGIILWTAS